MGNHNSGRRSKPTALKLAEGVRKDRINSEEPTPSPGEPTRPTLTADAQAHWARLAPSLLALGTLTVSDGDALANLCELLATRDLIVREKSSEGFKPFVIEPVVTADGGTHLKVKPHPALAVERQTAQSCRAYFDMFGLSPTSRTRIRVPPTDRKPTGPMSLRDFAKKKGPVSA